MIEQKHKRQIEQRAYIIMSSISFTPAEKRMLYAAVYAMADEFHDKWFNRIASDEPNSLPFFCDCVRHHWARTDVELTPCSLTSRAIRCPFTDAEILALVKRHDDSIKYLESPRAKEQAMPVKIPDSLTIGRTAFEALSRKFPGRSVDELLLHPDDAQHVCNVTRTKLGKRLRDDEILRSLLNARKQGKLK